MLLPLQLAAERRRRGCARQCRLVRAAAELRCDSALADRDLAHLGHPIGHLARAEALREDDSQHDGRLRTGRPCRRAERERGEENADEDESASHRNPA